MSESPKYSRPHRENANTHPADILLNTKQKCRSPAEKAAADKAKAVQDQESAMKAQKDRHMAVAQIAQLEDAIQREDKAYPIITGERGPRKSKTAVTTIHYSDYHDTDTSNSDTKGTAPKGNVQGLR